MRQSEITAGWNYSVVQLAFSLKTHNVPHARHKNNKWASVIALLIIYICGEKFGFIRCDVSWFLKAKHLIEAANLKRDDLANGERKFNSNIRSTQFCFLISLYLFFLQISYKVQKINPPHRLNNWRIMFRTGLQLIKVLRFPSLICISRNRVKQLIPASLDCRLLLSIRLS